MLIEPSYLAYVLIACFGLGLWWRPLWPGRSILAWALVVVETVAAIGFLYKVPGLGSTIFASIAAYKVFNYARLIRNRMQIDHLRRTTLRAAWLLSFAQVVTVIIISLRYDAGNWATNAAYGIAATQLLVAFVMLSSTQRHLKTTKTLQATTSYTDQQLPSLSVLIPARNETDDLHACLEALIASDYPKLEIIVLDDCSQDKRTPEIIRSFAQQGVRFIAGGVPDDNWLAKNYAYQQLADVANGDLLLFCGVDLQMTPGALRELVTTMLEKNKSMISILPHNDRPHELRTLLVQPMRYAWELSLPRRLFNRPPVLSTCWIIKKDSLRSAGSFKATSRSIVPESHFARFAARNDGYSFLRSNLLVSNKPARDQQATTIRMRYPQLHRRPELVWALTLLELISLFAPLPLAVIAIWQGEWPVLALSALSFVIQGVVFMEVTGVMYGRPLVRSFWLAPMDAAYDVVLTHISMYRYEFSHVEWKERDVCLPIMRFDVPAELQPSSSVSK
jgi:glycosyltransferase involved in cell wall biosynthesis